jgi:glycosyltransferase involved in cell wall biosynthesis
VKILYVIDNLEFGGGERGFLQIIEGLYLGSCSVKVACNYGGEFEARLRAMNILLERVNMKSKFNLFTILKLIRILKEGRFNIVHTQGARADFFGRVAGRLVGVPHILCTIQMPVEGFDVGRLRKKIYRFIDRLTECYVETFIVVSDFLKKILIERRGIPARRVVKIYNGIELSQYHPDAEHGNLRKEWSRC